METDDGPKLGRWKVMGLKQDGGRAKVEGGRAKVEGERGEGVERWKMAGNLTKGTGEKWREI